MYRLSILFIISLLTQTHSSWRALENGLELGSFHSPVYPDTIQAVITILRIDPAYFSLRLLCSSDPAQDTLHSTMQWCKKERLVAAINASMYQADYKTSVSLMKTSKHTNNAFLSRDKTILAFDPKYQSIPQFHIIDRQCEEYSLWKQKYSSFVQNIRMISCTGKNVWEQGKSWSIAALGSDRKGRLLFIFSGTPHSVYEFNNILLNLPIDIDRAMYLDGGHIAQLAISTGKFSLELIGEITGTDYAPATAPQIPNVLGIVRKKR